MWHVFTDVGQHRHFVIRKCRVMAKPSFGSLPLSEPSNTYSHSALNGKVLRKGCYVLHVRHGFFSYDAANIQRENAKVKKKVKKKSCTGHVFSESVSQSTQD